MAAEEVWEVVGGAGKGGILVRTGCELDSPQAPERLSTGALVRQLQLQGDRLQFLRLTGDGPKDGWVSTSLPGKQLLVRTEKRPPSAASTAPAQPSGFPSGLSKEGWHLYAVSDLHVDYPDNQKWVESLPEVGHERDAVILAGDISHRVDLVRWTLKEFRRRFGTVFYCVGNHELWVKRPDARSDAEDGEGGREFGDSCEKFMHLMALAEELGVEIGPKRLGEEGSGTLWVVPLQSWYEAEFGQPGEELKALAKVAFTDFHQVIWPEDVGTTPDDAARHFDELNDATLAGLEFGEGEPLVTFSHFLPRLELMPAQLPESMQLLRAGVGTKRLEERIRALGSRLHVFGHSHVNWYTHWNGIHYVQNALRYPQERRAWKSRVDVPLGKGQDPLAPFAVWSSHDPKRFCSQPERCGRGCPFAKSSSEFYQNKDSKTAAATWKDLGK